jgi:hypothetical protein
LLWGNAAPGSLGGQAGFLLGAEFNLNRHGSAQGKRIMQWKA